MGQTASTTVESTFEFSRSDYLGSVILTLSPPLSFLQWKRLHLTATVWPPAIRPLHPPATRPLHPPATPSFEHRSGACHGRPWRVHGDGEMRQCDAHLFWSWIFLDLISLRFPNQHCKSSILVLWKLIVLLNDLIASSTGFLTQTATVDRSTAQVG